MNTKEKSTASQEQTESFADKEMGAEAPSGETADVTYTQDQENDGAEAGTDEAASSGSLSEQLEAVRREAEDNQQRFLRTQADFENFRRRTRLEKEELAKYASAKLVESLVPVVDNFERAIAAGKESKDFDSLLKGLEMTFRQISQVLTQEGLQVMETVGKPFNPEYHQAIMQVESDEHEEGIVVEEVQKGYLLKDKVLRPAMVKVSS